MMSPLQMAKRVLNRTWEPPRISILTQVERLKAHHSRAEPVKVPTRMGTRYGLTIPHFTQKGADWKNVSGRHMSYSFSLPLGFLPILTWPCKSDLRSVCRLLLPLPLT